MSCLKKDLKVLNPVKPPAYTGLLNDYSGAAAAYSLRLLDNTYTGDAIVVTTNGTNSQSIGFVDNELDTATLESFAAGGDAYVATWYDQSGNGNDVTQSTFSEMPKIVSSGSTILEDGLPTINFGNFGRLYLNSFDAIINEMPTTGIFVAKGVASSATGPVSLVGSIGGADDFGMTTEIAIRTGGGYRLWANTTPQTQLSIVSMFQPSSANISDVECSLNGSVLTATGIGDNIINYGSTTNLFIGAKNLNSFDGVVSEAIIYPTDESANRLGIETNINDFYSIY
jgi:hypothetical protein